jgi:hypothetical protein
MRIISIGKIYEPNLNNDTDEHGDTIWTNSKGQVHREDGPAYIGHNDICAYYINGVLVAKDEWLDWLRDGKSSLNQKTILRLILEHS